FGVRVQQHLVGVESMPLVGLVRAMRAKAIQLTGSNVGKVTVPDMVRLFGKRDSMRLARGARRIEQAKIDASRVGRKDCEVDTLPVPGRSQGRRPAWPNSHRCQLLILLLTASKSSLRRNSPSSVHAFWATARPTNDRKRSSPSS